jgi:transposase
MSTAVKQPAKNGSHAQRSALKRKARGRRGPQGPGHQRRSKLTISNPDAAGIDVGSRVHYVAVPGDRAEVSLRSFGADTAQLDELVQWLKECGIKTAAMESTGVYWIALFQKLEEAGLEVLLVDARQAKHVPGRKSDVQDCQWLQQLHRYGLLRAAFRPEDAICRLRTLQRHRKDLVEYAGMWIQHMQKALNEMNLHLHHVLRDISGYSGLAILDAILAGERDPRKLASLAHYRVQKSKAQIEAALTGDYRPEQLFVLSQALQNYRQIQQQIGQCDLSIEQQLAKIADCTNPYQDGGPAQQEPEAPGCQPARRKAPNRKPLELSLAGHLKRILGVDLMAIPGLDVLAVLTLLERDWDQYDQVAPRESLRLLAGIKPQPQDQWTAGAKLPHTQSTQPRGHDITSGGDGAGQNQHPLGLLLPQKTCSARCAKGHDSDRPKTRLSDLSAHQKGPRLPRTRSAHL